MPKLFQIDVREIETAHIKVWCPPVSSPCFIRDLLRFQRLKFYLIAYCIYRFATEFVRPEPIFAAGLTFYQWFTLFFAIGLTLQWNWDRYWIHCVKAETR